MTDKTDSFFKFNEVRTVHLELSEACNAACPMCDRYCFGGQLLNPIVKNNSIDLDYFKQIFPKSFLKQLNKIIICGVLGDPLMAKDLLEQIQFAISINPEIKIIISTNGALRSKAWWQTLGSICNSKQKRVAFAIDGMSDTHALYRRNTSWNKIIENARAFIAAGGYAECQFLRFSHNEHQEAELKEFVAKIGFKIFDAKDSERFTLRKDGSYRYPVRNYEKEKILYYLEPPSDVIPKKFSNKDLDSVSITCHVWKSREIYISAKGEVFPCCYLFSDIKRYPKKYLDIIQNTDLLKVSKELSVEKIVNGNFFRKVSDSWRLTSITSGKIKKCAETCGVNIRVEQNAESLQV